MEMEDLPSLRGESSEYALVEMTGENAQEIWKGLANGQIQALGANELLNRTIKIVRNKHLSWLYDEAEEADPESNLDPYNSQCIDPLQGFSRTSTLVWKDWQDREIYSSDIILADWKMREAKIVSVAEAEKVYSMLTEEYPLNEETQRGKRTTTSLTFMPLLAGAGMVFPLYKQKLTDAYAEMREIYDSLNGEEMLTSGLGDVGSLMDKILGIEGASELKDVCRQLQSMRDRFVRDNIRYRQEARLTKGVGEDYQFKNMKAKINVSQGLEQEKPIVQVIALGIQNGKDLVLSGLSPGARNYAPFCKGYVLKV